MLYIIHDRCHIEGGGDCTKIYGIYDNLDNAIKCAQDEVDRNTFDYSYSYYKNWNELYISKFILYIVSVPINKSFSLELSDDDNGILIYPNIISSPTQEKLEFHKLYSSRFHEKWHECF